VIAGVRGWHLDEVYLKIDASAAWLLKMRVHAKKYGDPGDDHQGCRWVSTSEQKCICLPEQ
jgi:hypothetical protein